MVVSRFLCRYGFSFNIRICICHAFHLYVIFVSRVVQFLLIDMNIRGSVTNLILINHAFLCVKDNVNLGERWRVGLIAVVEIWLCQQKTPFWVHWAERTEKNKWDAILHSWVWIAVVPNELTVLFCLVVKLVQGISICW